LLSLGGKSDLGQPFSNTLSGALVVTVVMPTTISLVAQRDTSIGAQVYVAVEKPQIKGPRHGREDREHVFLLKRKIRPSKMEESP
jgi:hypothetical protein